MTAEHRKVKVAYPDARPGTCCHCNRPCSGHARAHPECQAQHQAKTGSRQAALERGGGVCIDRDKSRCKGPIESDHVQRLADNGPPEWTVLRCRKHHQEKDQAAADTARAAGRTRPGGRPVTQRSDSSDGHPVIGLAAILAAVAMWYYGWVPQLPGRVDGYAKYAVPIGVAVVVVSIAAIVGIGLLRRRSADRAAELGRLAEALAKETYTVPERLQLTVGSWEGRRLVAGSCRYSPVFADDEDGPARRGVEATLTRKIGIPLRITWHPADDTVTWRPAPDTEPEPVDRAAPAVAPRNAGDTIARIQAGVESVLDGTGVSVAVHSWHPDGRPSAIGIGYTAAAKVHLDRVQDLVEDKIATLFEGAWHAVWDTQRDTATFTDTPDPLADVIYPGDLPDTADLRALVCGKTETGDPWRVRLAQTHLLVGGASASGKGSVLWSLVHALYPNVADGSVELWAIDPKGGMELGRGRQVFARFAVTPANAVGLLGQAVEYMQERAARLATAGSRQHAPKPGDPMVVLIIDEIATLTKYGTSKQTREKIGDQLGLLLSQGRAVGVCVVGALQDPRKEVLALRDLFTTRIALRLTESTAADMVLGNGARIAGARADRISADTPGVGYMMTDTSPVPTRFRAMWVGDDRIDAMVAGLRADGRPQQLMLTSPDPDAADASAGETLPVEMLEIGWSVMFADGDTGEVTGLDPDPGDPYRVEVTYRRTDGTEHVWSLEIGTPVILID